MKSSIRSRVAAAVMFLLIAFVVLGGMGWATASSVELAWQNIVKERERRERERQDMVSNALTKMDAYMGMVLGAETQRSYEDYRAFVTKKPVAVYSRSGFEHDADWVTVASDLLVSGPPQEWIDLYFQLNPTGDPYLYSAQLADDAVDWVLDEGSAPPYELWPRARETWEILKTAVPQLDIRRHVAEGLASHRGPSVPPTCQCPDGTCRCAALAEAFGSAPADAGGAVAGTTASLAARPELSREYRQRKRSLRDSQLGYLPQPACVDEEVAELNVRRVAAVADTISGTRTQVGRGGVQITMDPIVAFWLQPAPGGVLKLLFVRECHADVDVFYQGFVGDWSLLKPELLEAAAPFMPGEWDIEPILDETQMSAETSRMQMSNLPVRLSVPPLPPGPTIAAAWEDVRGTLITSWVAAAAVLVVAGLGLRNLVALTERRMQFAYAVTHELRTPLTTFRLYSDMLSAGLVPAAKRQEYLDTLNRESIRLSSLVEEVLEYARLESHNVRLNAVETDGDAILAAVKDTLDHRCHENGLEPRAENAMTNGSRVQTDVDVVNRIAGVLINNACRHARGNNGAAVLVRVGDGDGHVYMDVIDTGPGVDRADARNIFKPFRRGKGAEAAAQGGIGLGLALARSWAELLGGRLDLAHRKHPQYGGAHFRLTIPSKAAS